MYLPLARAVIRGVSGVSVFVVHDGHRLVRRHAVDQLVLAARYVSPLRGHIFSTLSVRLGAGRNPVRRRVSFRGCGGVSLRSVIAAHAQVLDPGDFPVRVGGGDVY